MPNKSWAPGCKSNYYPNDAYSPVFKSPEDPELRQAWLEATALLQNAVSCIEDHSNEDIDDKSNDAPFLPSLQFILCQLGNLCIQKNRRRYNTITQIIALKAHLISSTC